MSRPGASTWLDMMRHAGTFRHENAGAIQMLRDALAVALCHYHTGKRAAG